MTDKNISDFKEKLKNIPLPTETFGLNFIDEDKLKDVETKIIEEKLKNYTDTCNSTNQFRQLMGNYLDKDIVDSLFSYISELLESKNLLSCELSIQKERERRRMKFTQETQKIEISNLQNMKLINQGSQGEVYLAEYYKKTVAVKKFLNLTEDSKKYKEFFKSKQSEFLLFWKLKHPNIISYYGYSEDDNYLYLVMEYVPDNLSSIIYKSNLKTKDKLAIIYEIAIGIHYLHSQKITHGDLKPQNILVRILFLI